MVNMSMTLALSLFIDVLKGSMLIALFVLLCIRPLYYFDWKKDEMISLFAKK